MESVYFRRKSDDSFIFYKIWYDLVVDLSGHQGDENVKLNRVN